MFCAIYRSPKKEQTYLYIRQKDQFQDVPEALMATFGKPMLVMVVNLANRQKLASVNIDKVKSALSDTGYYLQLPPPPINCLEEYKANLGVKKNKGRE